MPLDLAYWFALILLLYLSTLGYGLCVLWWLKLTPHNTPMYIIYASGIGYGTTAYLIFALGILQVLYPGLAYLVLILGLSALYFKRQDFKNGMGRLFKDLAQVAAPPFSMDRWAWLSFIVLFMFLNLSVVLTPPISKDALIYHLVGPRIFAQNHGIGFISGNFYTNFPFTTEMLFATGMLLKGPILAKLIHFSFGVLTLVAIFQWTASRSTVSAGLLAAAVYYTLPLVAKLSGWAYVDLSLTFFVLLMITALLDWKESHQTGFLLLVGMFGGLAMGTKYSGIVMVLIILLGAVLFLRSENHLRNLQIGPKAILVLFIAAVVASPWYLKNWILTGNPTYPFLYSLFNGREWSQEMAKTYAMFLSFVGSGPGILNYLRLPWDVCFVGGAGRPDFDGYIGPIFLLVPILSIAVRPKSVDIRLMLFFSLLYFVLWGMLIQQLRLLLPIFPVLSIVLALLIHKGSKAWLRTRLCILFFCLFTLAINLYFHLDYVRRIAPQKYLSGIQTEAQFLKSHLPSYPAIEYINDHLTDQDKVLFVFLGSGPYYCIHPNVYDPVFEANTLMDVVKTSTSAGEALAHFRQKAITHVLTNHDYVPSIASILGERHREKYFKLMGLLSPQASFGNYRLYRVSEQS
jgi:4-amino-4-deoxy-L-arabinose transferase-like glycosyltransferase